MTMKNSYTNAQSIMDSSFAYLDTDFLMSSDLVKSSRTVPKSPARALPTIPEPTANFTAYSVPTTGGFCLTPQRGLGTKTLSQRHHLGFSACMAPPLTAPEETINVPVPKEQKRTSARTSASEKLASHYVELEAELRIKEKECLELRELVESCSHALPQRTMAGRKAVSMTNLGANSSLGKQQRQRQVSFGLDSDLTRESAEEKSEEFEDVSHRFQRRASADNSGLAKADTVVESICVVSKISTSSKRPNSRVLPRRTMAMAGRMAASMKRQFSFRSKKGLPCDVVLVDNTAESVESDSSAW